MGSSAAAGASCVESAKRPDLGARKKTYSGRRGLDSGLGSGGLNGGGLGGLDLLDGGRGSSGVRHYGG